MLYYQRVIVLCCSTKNKFMENTQGDIARRIIKKNSMVVFLLK